MKQLSSYVHDQKPWNSNEAKTSLSISDFTNQQSKRSAPSGCTFLNTSGKKVRWNIFPDLSVGVHYNSGATGCGSSVSAAQDAISTLQNAYDGINILDAGSSTFSANCADFSALGADYRSYMDNTYGNYRHVIIQFEDPCSEISDLKSCGGTLAIGGAYGVGSHTYLDTAWATAKYGYVVVNNGVGNCFCSSMTDLLTHELTHTLGLGHISANVGTANLNPVCCHSITALDNQCVDYAYPPPGAVQLLPVELVSFNGVADPYYNQLFWSTASEQNVNRFIIERANSNGSQFETIGAVLSQGETSVGHAYEWLDKSPMQNNYYRLRTTDWDGQEDLSNIIVVKRQEGIKPAIYPTMTNGEINIAIPGGEEVRLKIFSVAGELISEYNIAYSSAIDLKDLVNGWYLIRLENANFSEIFRVLKI